MTFDQILQYLSGPGLEAAIAFLLFVFLPDMLGRSWEEVVPPTLRRPIFAVICMVLPVLSAMMRVWLGFVTFDFDAVLVPAILAGGAAYLASTVALGFRKLPSIAAFMARKSAGAAGVDLDDGEDEAYRWTG